MLGFFKSEFLDGLSSGATALAARPSCPGEQAARDGYSVQSSAGPTVYWCFGEDSSGERILRVVNNRPYPLEIQHPGLSPSQNTLWQAIWMPQDARLDQGEEIPPDVINRLLAGDGQAAAGLARRGEGQQVELKLRLPQEPALARELAAFANSGGGVLIVGVSDDGQLAGWRPVDADHAVRRMRAIADSFIPNLAHVRRGQTERGWLVWIVVDSASEPIPTAEGIYWQRASGRVLNAELPAQGVLADTASNSVRSLTGPGAIRVFVAMSFREEEEPALVDYWHAMLRAAEKSRREFNLIRMDNAEGDYDIVERMYAEIDGADLVIADLTLSPANVYLEIGYARGKGKPVIQTCRHDTSLEFDVRGRRTLIYRNATTLEEKLLREMDAL
jgi:nucleoside 2-deoxyribosyltransferase